MFFGVLILFLEVLVSQKKTAEMLHFYAFFIRMEQLKKEGFARSEIFLLTCGSGIYHLHSSAPQENPNVHNL